MRAGSDRWWIEQAEGRGFDPRLALQETEAEPRFPLYSRVLATLAGHRDPRSILKYARLSPTAVATALRRLRERK